jgi:hypothetical protein
MAEMSRPECGHRRRLAGELVWPGRRRCHGQELDEVIDAGVGTTQPAVQHLLGGRPVRSA